MVLRYSALNRKLLCVLLISTVLQDFVQSHLIVSVDEPISFNVGYSNSHGHCVNWSSKDVYKDYTHYYQVLTYTNYSDSIDNFISKYPTVTIQTSGYAYSHETIGDVGSGKFGSLTFQTTDFKNKDYFERFLVNEYADSFWWNIQITIGIGFKYEENKLYIRPFIDGWIYSGGAEWRCTNYALDVATITFNPAGGEYYRYHSE